MMKKVPALLHRHVGMQGRSQKRQISEQIDDLMANEFISKAESTFIQDSVVVQHDRVLEVSSQREPPRAKRLHFVNESEGARARQLACEAAGIDVE